MPPSLAEQRLDRLLSYLRRRLRTRDLLWASSLGLGLCAASATVLVLAAAALGPRPVWRPLMGAWLIAATSACVGLLGSRARRRRRPEELARHIGRGAPDLRSDLLSAIQLGRELSSASGGDGPYKTPRTSAALVLELNHRMAAAAATVDLDGLSDLRKAAWTLGLLVLLGLPGLGLLCFHGGPLKRGILNLFAPPQDPVARSSEPLVGDIRLTLTYPRYTGLPPRTIPGSSGDVLALPGTQVRVDARALVHVERAQLQLSLGEHGQPTRPVQVTPGGGARGEGRGGASALLSTTFNAQHSGAYAFVIERARNDRVREAEGHRIDLEQDHPPRVELFVPAEDLEISPSRRVELAYSAEDDLGLGEIALVFKVGTGPEQRKRLRAAPERDAAAGKAPPRTAAAKVEWDLSEIDLQPGVRVTYRLEARDLDNVTGPNVGSSRSYTLRITSPREKHDAMLARQETLQEASLLLLADRIDLNSGADHARPDGVDLSGVHRQTEFLLLQMGRVQEELSADPMLPRDLRPALQEISRRLGKLTQEEAQLVSDASRRAGRDGKRPARPGRGRELLTMNERHVTELERDVILLDDLLGRQRLEELLALGDEMTATRDRLRQLLQKYKKTRSESLRTEIEREIRELERRLGELADKAQKLKGEIPDEFLNSEAMGKNDMQARLDRVRDLLQAGDVDKAMAELERLSQSLDSLMKGMESDLRGFRKERFSAEDKALGEIEDRLADLSHDEEGLKRETEDIKGRVSAKSRLMLRDRADALVRRLQDKVARLKKQIADVEIGPLGPWGSDELEKAQKRVEDLGQMLDQGDLDEARAMAQEAEQSIGKLAEELRGEEGARPGHRGQLSRSRVRLEQARPMARELVDEIGRALPRRDELLSPEDQRQLQELRGRQEALRRRAAALQQTVQRRARETKDAPILEKLSQEIGDTLQKAGGHMEQAETDLRGLSPRGAATAEGQALEKLGRMRQQMQQARRPRDEGAGARLDREPVKIPGADDYRAPREFRQDILQAAKREAPQEYREQVKRYYEELVK